MPKGLTNSAKLMETKPAPYLNFSPGPAIIPDEVIKAMQKRFKNRLATGFSPIETSHRGKHFLEILDETQQLIAKLLHLDKTPSKFHILLTQGGASMEFVRIAANLLLEDGKNNPPKKAYYIDSGFWVAKAYRQASILCNSMPALTTTPELIASSAQQSYRFIPNISTSNVEKNAAYIYLCSNNTIAGTQYENFNHFCSSEMPEVPLVCDATSDFFAKEIPPEQLEKFGIIFASTQKNLGTAGLTVVLIRNDILERLEMLASSNALQLPTQLNYLELIKLNSLSNTPNVFAITMLLDTLHWINSNGGIASLEAINRKKSALIYEMVDTFSIYEGHAKQHNAKKIHSQRSIINTVFHVRKSSENGGKPSNESPLSPTPSLLEKKFLQSAEENNMHTLRGHKLLGGVRASMYNAFPLDGAVRFANFMESFAKKHG